MFNSEMRVLSCPVSLHTDYTDQSRVPEYQYTVTQSSDKTPPPHKVVIARMLIKQNKE